MPQTLRELHRQYGDIVRIGPNELAFFSLDATDTILGSKGKMNRGPWCVVLAACLSSYFMIGCRYDSTLPEKGGVSVHALKAIGPHAQRRKFWDMAMTSKPVVYAYHL